MYIKSFFKFLNESNINEILEIIDKNKKIFVKYIENYPGHNRKESYEPIDVDNDGNISLRIDDGIYYTKVEWVEGIDTNENIQSFEVTANNLETNAKPDNEVKYWKKDKEFLELLKDNGGLKKTIKKIKKVKDIDYSDCKSEEELYAQLKGDNML
jgi:hypothetical protein